VQINDVQKNGKMNWSTDLNESHASYVRWRKKAQNREEWASVMKEAKVLKGPQCQGASKQTVSYVEHCYYVHVGLWDVTPSGYVGRY
jgi:hypothetical protein